MTSYLYCCATRIVLVLVFVLHCVSAVDIVSVTLGNVTATSATFSLWTSECLSDVYVDQEDL